MPTRPLGRPAKNGNLLVISFQRKRSRLRHGGSIAELAASLTILLPIIIVGAFVAIESAQVFMINAALNQSASWAARQVAIAYGSNPTATKANPTSIFRNIKFMNIVVSPQQFQIPSQGGWNESSQPPSVTVVVSFKSGTYGCPTFPNPDPLGLGSNLTISARATCRLE